MIGVNYTGTDGSLWDLRRGPVQITKGGLQGLGFPPMTEYTDSPALLHGQTFSGFKFEARRLVVPLLLGVDTRTEDDWETLQSAWWDACTPGLYGSLAVTAPSGKIRTVALRFSDDNGVSYDQDPTVDAWEALSVAWTADLPLFLGPLQEQSFDVDANGINFLGGGDPDTPNGGPPFYISSSATVGDGLLSNPGDVDAWPRYVLEAPATAFVSTLGGGTVSAAIAVTTGHVLTIDTDPQVQLATLTNTATGDVVDVTGQLVDVDWRPVPRRGSLPLHVSITGTGSLSVELSPGYFRGF